MYSSVLANKYIVTDKIVMDNKPETIYKAIAINSQKEFIIKEISLYDQNTLFSFNNRLNKIIENDSILKIYQHFIENNKLYIVTESTNGKIFSEFIKDKVTFNNIISILIELSESLSYLNSIGIKNINISFENIYIINEHKIKLDIFNSFEKTEIKDDLESFGLLLYQLFKDKKNIPNEINNITGRLLDKSLPDSIKDISELNRLLNMFYFKLNSHLFSELSLTGTNGTNNSTKKKYSGFLSEIVGDQYFCFEGFSLKNIITDYILKKATGLIETKTDNNVASIYIKDGEFIHAEYNNKKMFSIDIFYEIICWEKGEYCFKKDIIADNNTFDSIPADLLLSDSDECLENFKIFNSKYKRDLVPVTITEIKNIHTFSPQLIEVLSMVNGKRTIEEIIKISSMDVSSILLKIDELFSKGFIAFR